MDNFGVYVQLCLYRFRCAINIDFNEQMPYENVECSGLSVKFMCGGDAVNKRNELTRANWFLHTMRTLAH